MTEHPQWTVDSNVKVLCRDCTAECCKHIGIPIDPPETWEDYQRIKAYICHENVSCYLDVEGDWVVEFVSKCGQLNGNRCMAWGTKDYPSICGDYEMATCVMNEEGEWWEILFKTPADVDAHCQKLGLQGPPFEPKEPCVSVPIDTPEDWKDFDDIRWYLAHRDVMVYKHEGAWYVHLNSMCKATCPYKNSHLPTQYEVALRSWQDVYSYCSKHGITPPAPTGKEALKLTAG
jgi:hypothetical protein